MPNHSIRILHISDLHEKGSAEKAKWRRRRVLGDAWLENLNLLKSEWRSFDIVCFTGDIAFSGKDYELASATEFIEATLSTVGVPWSLFFPIPGNHDVNRDLSFAEWNALRNFCDASNDAAVSNWLAGAKPPVGAIESWPDAIAVRSSAYNVWLETTLKRPDLLPQHSPHGHLGYRSTVQLPDRPFPIHIVGLNSAWLAGDDHDSRKLRVTEDQAMRLVTNENGDALNGFRLGLIHHPLGELADGEHCRMLVSDKLDLLLRGHLHSPELLTVMDPDRVLNELATGCLYEHDRYPNGCSVLELNLDSNGALVEMAVHFRAWSPAGFWYNDDSRYRQSRSGLVRLTASTSGARRIFAYSSTVPRTAVAGIAQFERLEERFRARTHLELVSGETRLVLPREDTVAAFVAAIESNIQAGDILVASGEPGTGKSAVAVNGMDRLRTREHHVVSLSLRDLPVDPVQVDALFGGSVRDVLRQLRAKDEGAVLIIDGAEAMLEDRSATLAELVRSAVLEQYSVVTVARDDARDALRLALVDVTNTTRSVTLLPLPALSPEEVEVVLASFPSLQQLGEDPRAAWLLSRPGWVSLLLRASPIMVPATDAISEAHVYGVIWRSLVRRNEASGTDLATPDGRETVLLALARRALLGTVLPTLDPHSLSSLRRDGLLLPFEAMGSGDEFAHDLIRDFSVARLLMLSMNELVTAGAPRWALRAARLVFQAALLSTGDLSMEVSRQLALSRTLAVISGDRWLDIVFEALLEGQGITSIISAWPALIANQAEGLLGLLRWLRVHHYMQLAAETAIAAPVVEMICAHNADLATLDDRCDADVEKAVHALLDAWLFGLANRMKNDEAHSLRQRVRDLFLRPALNESNPGALRGIALLGPDLDPQAETYVRARAAARPDELEECVEGSGILSLAYHRIDLLFFLAEAYYLDDTPGDYDLLDDGIRGHARGVVPLTAWCYGPFAALLRKDFHRACRLINKLLNHAARIRGTGMAHRGFLDPGDSASLELYVTGGPRVFFGDAQVWHWYRATGVGPYPCISALMALEKVIDEIFAAAPDLPFDRVISRAMDDAESLAMAGCVVGMLTRHLERVVDELDVWFTNPAVWHLEHARVVKEYAANLGVSAESNEQQKARRMWTPMEVSHFLMKNALLSDDARRLQQLASAGETLLSRATATTGGDPGPVVRKWTSALDPKCYRRVTMNGTIAIVYEPPANVLAELSLLQAAVARRMSTWHLLGKYRFDVSDPIDDQSSADLVMAHDLWTTPPSGGPHDVLEVPTLVACRCLMAHFAGRFAMSTEHAEWSIELIIQAATKETDPLFDSAISPDGSDRSAARVLPRLYEHLVTQQSKSAESKGSRSIPARLKKWLRRYRGPEVKSKAAIALEAIGSLAVSESREVRYVLGAAIADVWDRPCTEASECFHRSLLASIRRTAAVCVLGPFDLHLHRYSVVALDEPLEQTLKVASAEEFVADRLVPSIVAIGACASSGSCCGFRKFWVMDSGNFDHRRRPCHATGASARVVAVRDGKGAVLVTR